MSETVNPDILVYVCHNAVPEGGRLTRQWSQDGAHVCTTEVPCSGKIDVQYLMHALEGGGHGICVVTCPKGKCNLSQGNYRAEVRIHTVKRLLTELGMESERIILVHSSPDDTPDQFIQSVQDAVKQLCSLGKSPLIETPSENQIKPFEVKNHD